MHLFSNPGSVSSFEIAYKVCANALILDPLKGLKAEFITLKSKANGNLCSLGVIIGTTVGNSLCIVLLNS